MKTALKITAVILVMFVMLSVCAFAAPDSLPLEATGTVSGILTVTNPASASISSYDRQHNISGYAAEGATVSVYAAYGDKYSVIKRFTVGASGVFVQPVTLTRGRNELLIRADVNGQVQCVKRTVNVLSINFFNLLKGFNLF